MTNQVLDRAFVEPLATALMARDRWRRSDLLDLQKRELAGDLTAENAENAETTKKSFEMPLRSPRSLR